MQPTFRKYFFCLVTLLLLVATSPLAWGQVLGENFGKNRVQKKIRKWQFVSTQNFDVYFYDGGRDLANYAARYAEQNFDRVVNIVGFSPYHKIKLMIYNSVKDAHQSNVYLEEADMQVGGYTSFVKSKVELPFRGTRTQFNADIDKGISDVLINVMMYGGNLKDVVQSSYLLALPEWFVEGASRYIAEGWSLEMDDYMRDMMRRKKIKRPSTMEGRQAHIVGQSIWNYIAKKYGEDNIANILNLTRIVRDEKESIENTIGVPYSAFLGEWQAYYREMETRLEENYIAAPENDFRIKKNKKKHFDFRNLSISPDGSKLAYSQSYKGRYKIIVADSNGHHSNAIMRGGYKLVHQPDNRNIPIVAWQNQKRLAYITSKSKDSYLNIYSFIDRKFYELYRKRKVKILLDDVKEVLSMDFSADGKYIAMSALRRGQSDIYIYDVYSDKLIQVTKDVYDDLTPQFVDSSNSIVFSSNRYTDTTTKARDRIFSHQTKFNIFRFVPTDSVKRFEKYTGEGNNYLPYKVSDGIIFSSDRTGILNLFKVSDDGSVIKQVTNYANNVKYYSINESTGSLAFIMLDEGKENIYQLRNFNFKRSLPPSMATDRALFFSKNGKQKSPISAIKEEKKESDFEINVFTFESDKKRKRKKKQEEEIKKEPQNTEFKSIGPYRAKPLFSIDHVVSTLKIDPLRGLGILADASMSDMFGDHKMNAGALIITDLQTNSIFAEYQYLKRRTDFRFRYDRSTYNRFGVQEYFQKYTLNNFMATASVPLSVFDRLSVSPFVAQTRYNEVPTPSNNSITARDSVRLYTGYKLEYLHDDTEITGMNMMVGTRFKISYEQFLNPANKEYNFGKFCFDFRRYQRIHKEVIFATRVSGGFFLGNAPKNFFLGGMDNWLFNNTKTYPTQDPLEVVLNKDNSDFLFSPFVTNLRGFDYNAAYGPKYLLLNAELRVPLIRYLYNGPITNNFFRNLQLTAFTDVGSAWSGISPFTQNNNINREIIGNNQPFVAEVTNYISPWLFGYGAGLRTLFLGYYVKMDVAWGVLNYRVQTPKIYLTIGYDF